MDRWIASDIWVVVSVCGRNPLEAERSSRLTDECAFQIPFYAEKGNTDTHTPTHTKDSCTLNWAEMSWHIHTPLSTQEHRQARSIDSFCPVKNPLKHGSLWSWDLPYQCVFEFFHDSATVHQMRHVAQTHNLTWCQLLCCTTLLCCLHHVVENWINCGRRRENRPSLLLYYCSGCSRLFNFKVKESWTAVS